MLADENPIPNDFSRIPELTEEQETTKRELSGKLENYAPPWLVKFLEDGNGSKITDNRLTMFFARDNETSFERTTRLLYSSGRLIKKISALLTGLALGITIILSTAEDEESAEKVSQVMYSTAVCLMLVGLLVSTLTAHTRQHSATFDLKSLEEYWLHILKEACL